MGAGISIGMGNLRRLDSSIQFPMEDKVMSYVVAFGSAALGQRAASKASPGRDAILAPKRMPEIGGPHFQLDSHFIKCII